MLQCQAHSECTNMATERGNVYSGAGSLCNLDEKDKCLLSSCKLLVGISLLLKSKEVKGGVSAPHCLHSGFFWRFYRRYVLFSSQNRNKGICFVEKKWGFGTNEEKRNIFYLFILRFKAETAYDKWQINKSMQIWADERAQLAKFLICKYEDLRSIPINQIRNLGTVWKRRQEAPWGLLNS